MAKKRLPVVEDSQTIISVVRYFLQLEGYEVLVAQNGAAGLELAKNRRPDAILTDYSTPGMDGMT
jgi:CheY-like chemotaxis protein